MKPDTFPYEEIEDWIAQQLPGWRWVDAIPNDMDPETGALLCKIEAKVGVMQWRRRYIWLFPNGSIELQEKEN